MNLDRTNDPTLHCGNSCGCHDHIDSLGLLVYGTIGKGCWDAFGSEHRVAQFDGSECLDLREHFVENVDDLGFLCSWSALVVSSGRRPTRCEDLPAQTPPHTFVFQHWMSRGHI